MPSHRDARSDAPAEKAFDFYDPADEKRRESLFSLGNGRLLVRGCAPQADRSEHHYPGTYHAGCYNRLFTVIEGEAVSNESLVNLPNWLPLTFRVAGEEDWFSLDRGEILQYRHALDMERGLAHREVLIRDRRGRETLVREERLVSMASPHLAAFAFSIEPRNWSGRVEIRTAVDGDVAGSSVARFSAYPDRHLDRIRPGSPEPGMLLVEARTRQSGIGIAVAARTRLSSGETRKSVSQDERSIVEFYECPLREGRPLTVEKTAAVFAEKGDGAGTARRSAEQALRIAPDFAGLRRSHVEAWGALWQRCRFAADDPVLSEAIRFHMFHILQTVSPNSVDLDVGFPARGWQEGYNGQVFWEEMAAFPFLNLHFPEIARALLLYRYRRLGEARRAAREAGFRGAMFPWRSASTGREETPRFQMNPLSGRWMPDDTHLQRHIGSAIAANIWRYVRETGDETFMQRFGAEMILEIARFWASISEYDGVSDRYGIRGVVGPDEYHTRYPGAAAPGLDDNAYTNMMAVWTLCRALDILDCLPEERRKDVCRKIGLHDEETERWRHVSRRMRLSFHEDGVISQFAGFGDLKPFDPATLDGKRADWVLEAERDQVNAYQVVKQADVLMLLYLLRRDEVIALAERLGYPLTESQLKRTADYYLRRTSHASSLSRIATAGALARLDLSASWFYFREALRLDLDPSERQSSTEGVHLGAMSSVLDVLRRRYFGLAIDGEGIRLDPALPPDLGGLHLAFECRFGAFDLDWNGARLVIGSSVRNRADVLVRQPDAVRPLAPGKELFVEMKT